MSANLLSLILAQMTKICFGLVFLYIHLQSLSVLKSVQEDILSPDDIGVFCKLILHLQMSLLCINKVSPYLILISLSLHCLAFFPCITAACENSLSHVSPACVSIVCLQEIPVLDR